jgi:hypothetical protein
VREVEGYAGDLRLLTDMEARSQPADEEASGAEGGGVRGEGLEGDEAEADAEVGTTVEGIRPSDVKLGVQSDAAAAAARGGGEAETEAPEVGRDKALRRLAMKQLLQGMRERRAWALELPTHTQPLHLRAAVTQRDVDERAAAQVSENTSRLKLMRGFQDATHH